MKKKLRDIVVNDVSYKWNINNNNGDGDSGKNLAIWKDGKLWHEKFFSGSSGNTITPSVVRCCILEAKKASI